MSAMSGEHGDPARLRELMLYVVAACRQRSSFDAPVLAGALYLCDFAAYDRLGCSITGSSYVKEQRGPVPSGFDEALDALVGDGRAVADVSLFTAPEIALVDEVVGRLDASADSEGAYGAGWSAVASGEEIPYCFAGVSDDELSDADLERVREIAVPSVSGA